MSDGVEFEPLSENERATLRPTVDVDALEELLRQCPANARDAVLNVFSRSPTGAFQVVGTSDPNMDALLRRIEPAP